MTACMLGNAGWRYVSPEGYVRMHRSQNLEGFLEAGDERGDEGEIKNGSTDKTDKQPNKPNRAKTKRTAVKWTVVMLSAHVQ